MEATKRSYEVTAVLALMRVHFGRRSNRALRQYITKLEAQSPLVEIGQRMSNWFYNIAQMDTLPSDIRAQAKRLCTEWDKARK